MYMNEMTTDEHVKANDIRVCMSDNADDIQISGSYIYIHRNIIECIASRYPGLVTFDDNFNVKSLKVSLGISNDHYSVNLHIINPTGTIYDRIIFKPVDMSITPIQEKYDKYYYAVLNKTFLDTLRSYIELSKEFIYIKNDDNATDENSIIFKFINNTRIDVMKCVFVGLI